MIVAETGKPRTSGGVYLQLLKQASHLPREVHTHVEDKAAQRPRPARPPARAASPSSSSGRPPASASLPIGIYSVFVSPVSSPPRHRPRRYGASSRRARKSSRRRRERCPAGTIESAGPLCENRARTGTLHTAHEGVFSIARRALLINARQYLNIFRATHQ